MDVKSVDVLAQLAVGGVEGVREADAAEGRRVVGEAGEAEEEGAHVERAAAPLPLRRPLERILDELTERFGGELTEPGVLLVSDAVDDRVEHRHRLAGILAVLLLVSQWITWTVSGRKRSRANLSESAARRSIAGKRWRY